MGKTLATLLHQREVLEGPHRGPAPPPAEQAPDEEVPFIEVGPHRSLEASPSVLAAGPRPAAPPAPARVEAPRPAVALRPLSPAPAVRFRPLPARPRLAPELVAFHAPGEPASAPYRELLGSLLSAFPGEARPVLLFTGALSGAGTTTALLNVAICAAQQGRRIAVVDAALSGPAVGARLGLPPVPGLREVLTGKATAERALQQTDQPGLQALTAGAGPAPQLTGEAVRSVLASLRQRFDLVLVDGPAWDGQADVVALAGACEAVYLVVPGDVADGPQVEALLRALPGAGARLAGCVITNVTA